MLTNKGKGIDYDKLKEECPKAVAELGGFMKSSLEEFQKAVMGDYEDVLIPEEWDIPELTPELIEESVKNLLSSGVMRTLYEFFDNRDVYVVIQCPDKDFNWTWWLYNKEMGLGDSNDESFNSRGQAEIAGFSEAFKVLEGKL